MDTFLFAFFPFRVACTAAALQELYITAREALLSLEEVLQHKAVC